MFPSDLNLLIGLRAAAIGRPNCRAIEEILIRLTGSPMFKRFVTTEPARKTR
jgi:hypothetical protein